MSAAAAARFPPRRLSEICDAYFSWLKQCCEDKSLNRVKQLHGRVIRTLETPETFLLNNFVSSYGKMESIEYARKMFDQIPRPNVFSWNSIMAAYSLNGHTAEMQELFNSIPKKDGVSWNLMISGYVKCGSNNNAFEGYRLMLKHGLECLNRITLVTILSMLSKMGCVDLCRAIHGQVVKFGFESSVFVGSSLVDIYAKLGSIDDARNMFDELPERNIVLYNTMLMALLRCGFIEDSYALFDRMTAKDFISWTTMVTGLTQNGRYKEALFFFREMTFKRLDLDQFTFGSALTACGGLSSHEEGKQIHSYIIRTPHHAGNIFVSSALVDMYSKCKDVTSAGTVFRMTRNRNVVSWTAMLVGYSQNGYSEEAVRIFHDMQGFGIEVDEFTLGSVISSCGNLATIEEGTQFHCKALVSGLISFVTVSNALVSLYGKCGNIEEARRMFGETEHKDQVTWTALVSGYSQFGRADESIDLFEEMLLHGLKPDGVTFLGVLSACSRAGLVEKGLKYFATMEAEYKIQPNLNHYTCVIDLYSRAGKLDEAKSFIQNMPFRPDTIGWTTLLSSCRNRGNIEIGKWAADSLLELDPKSPAAYVLLANIYAGKQRWDEVAELQRGMKHSGVRKEPGFSWIKFKSKVYTFAADDTSSPFLDQIHEKLSELGRKMREEGYVPDMKSVVHDVPETEKVSLLEHHSEKLAIAFGLIFIPQHLTIKVVKNLRVCDDCHNATKIISRITQRSVLVRDSVRYHLFEGGNCSCGDFW